MKEYCPRGQRRNRKIVNVSLTLKQNLNIEGI